MDVISAFLACLRLKSVSRTGWLKSGLVDVESVAEHSFSVAIISAILAKIKGLDPYKASLLGLVHDLPEAVTGDLTPWEKGRLPEEDLTEIEYSALSSILGGVPVEVREYFRGLYTEYLTKSSPEAVLVSEVDKLEMALQALVYSLTDTDFDPRPFLDSASQDLADSMIIELFKALVERVDRGTHK
ncbi:MAG: HD domain-containing protein [Aigarchaeota archaeon]|nr:HD domain-containing protein [Aigarchaeota archaeon]MDW8092886.1 HD domain-containing protein [Nitrososphaerota archaeon]